jgi:hypothetical protein
MRELPLARDFDEAGAMQVTEVARHRRLGNIEQLDQVADAELAGREKVEYPDPGRVREPFEEQIQVRNCRRHAR